MSRCGRYRPTSLIALRIYTKEQRLPTISNAFQPSGNFLGWIDARWCQWDDDSHVILTITYPIYTFPAQLWRHAIMGSDMFTADSPLPPFQVSKSSLINELSIFEIRQVLLHAPGEKKKSPDSWRTTWILEKSLSFRSHGYRTRWHGLGNAGYSSMFLVVSSSTWYLC